jgi:hypothetical protein
MAILPPLRLGCNRCILVGDPQQLPATVISQEAQTMLFSRSLFERFQLAGCPALMLTQQVWTLLKPLLVGCEDPARVIETSSMKVLTWVRCLGRKLQNLEHVTCCAAPKTRNASLYLETPKQGKFRTVAAPGTAIIKHKRNTLLTP